MIEIENEPRQTKGLESISSVLLDARDRIEKLESRLNALESKITSNLGLGMDQPTKTKPKPEQVDLNGLEARVLNYIHGYWINEMGPLRVKFVSLRFAKAVRQALDMRFDDYVDKLFDEGKVWVIYTKSGGRYIWTMADYKTAAESGKITAAELFEWETLNGNKVAAARVKERRERKVDFSLE